MKVFGPNGYEFSIDEAVAYATTPDPYSYEDKMGKLEVQIEKQQELLCRLVEAIFTTRLPVDKLKYILGHGFEVEE